MLTEMELTGYNFVNVWNLTGGHGWPVFFGMTFVELSADLSSGGSACDAQILIDHIAKVI